MFRFRLRSLLIVLALGLLAGAGVELYRFLVLLESDKRVLPTMYGEHAGLAAALACAGLIALLVAFRRSPIVAP